MHESGLLCVCAVWSAIAHAYISNAGCARFVSDPVIHHPSSGSARPDARGQGILRCMVGEWRDER